MNDNNRIVIPAKAGIQALNMLLRMVYVLDPRFRGDDGLVEFPNEHIQ